MRRRQVIRFVSVLLILAISGTVAARTAPTVYQDDNVIVRAGIVEAGTESIHIGDELTLSVDVLFDPGHVRIENLDDELFQQAFASSPQMRQYRPATVTTEEQANGQVRIAGEWRFQILDCPPQISRCPGPNTYDLPIISLSYQLAESPGQFSSDLRSVRFQPWPGHIDVAAAIGVAPQPSATLNDVLPGGAYPAALEIDDATAGSTVLALAGVILFGAGLTMARRLRPLPYTVAQSAAPSGRWEHALLRLFDDTLTDEQWSDLIRRSFTWYCTDQLRLNPYSWLGTAAIDQASSDANETPLREFFFEILSHAEIDTDHRVQFRERLLGLTGHAGFADKLDQKP